ncbi:MAG TPA: CaiB/BaiF CoA-transferase family protein [Micromonosporaceae bacterium]|jgi:crotonobetainyl-CoA:carnitine CoA-transferase CaiB-like acyl-CoA transferase
MSDGTLTENEPTEGILAGLTVIELAEHSAAPIAGAVLADLGADVIKIERPPRGDPSRYLDPVPVGECSGTFFSSNRGKRSVVLDLKTEAGSTALHRLLDGADVLITNLRDGARRRLGIDDAAVAGAHPGLIYVSVSGFGESPAAADMPAFDTVALARAGVLDEAMSSFDGSMDMRVYIADTATGYLTAMSILAAVIHKMKTGQGQRVETSMLRSAMCFAQMNFARHAQEVAYGRGRKESARSRSGGYTFVCGDDRAIAVHLVQSPEKFWPLLAGALEREDLLADERFATGAERTRHRTELRAVLAPEFRHEPAAVWVERLLAAGVPCAPINRVSDLPDDELVQASGGIREVPDQDGIAVPVMAYPATYSVSPSGPFRPAPRAGEDTETVLRSMDFSEEQIESLRADGVAWTLSDLRDHAAARRAAS